MRNMRKLFALSVLSALYALLQEKHVAAGTCWNCDQADYWQNCPNSDCPRTGDPAQNNECWVSYQFCNGN
jgi:hypothetical protein